MLDEASKIAALATNFRRRRADGSLTLAALKTIASDALTGVLAGTSIINLNFEGGGASALMHCEPSIALAAAEAVIAEDGVTEGATGATHLDLSGQRIET